MREERTEGENTESNLKARGERQGREKVGREKCDEAVEGARRCQE